MVGSGEGKSLPAKLSLLTSPPQRAELVAIIVDRLTRSSGKELGQEVGQDVSEDRPSSKRTHLGVACAANPLARRKKVLYGRYPETKGPAYQTHAAFCASCGVTPARDESNRHVHRARPSQAALSVAPIRTHY
jgi:hypothetical protein